MTEQKVTKSQLMKAFLFGTDELTANKQGMLTAKQQKLLLQHINVSRFSSTLAMIVTLASIIGMFGILLFIPQGAAIKQAVPFLAGVAFLVFVIMGIFTLIGLRRLKTLQKQEVSVVEGAVRLASKKLEYGMLNANYVWVDKIRMQLTSEKQCKVLKDGKPYRIYYVQYPPTHIILSIEQME